jgi:hypothetical protein
MAIYSEEEQSMGSLIVGHVQVSNEMFYGEEIGVGPVEGINWPKGLLLSREGSYLIPYQEGSTSSPVAVLPEDLLVPYYDEPTPFSPIIGGSVRRDKLIKYTGNSTFSDAVTPTETDLMRKFRCIGTSVIDLTVRPSDEPPVVPPFDPSVFGTLLAAYDARLGITLSGSRVAAWAPFAGSLAGTAYGTLSQATEVEQPTISTRADGKKTILFADAQKLCGALFSADTTISTMSIVVAYRRLAAPVTLRFLATLNSADGTKYIRTWYNPGAYMRMDNQGGASSALVYRTPLPTPLTSIAAFSQSATGNKAWAPSGTEATSGVATPTPVSSLCVGAQNPGGSAAYCWGSEVSALWLYGSAMDAAGLSSAGERMLLEYPELT